MALRGKKRTTGSVFELLEEADRQQNARSLRKAGHKKGMTPPQPGRSARKNQKRRAKKQAAEAKAAAEKAQAIAEAAAAAQDVAPEPVPRVPAAIAAAAAAGAPQVPARGPNTSRRPGAGAPNPAVPARAVGGPAGAGGSTPAAPVASAPTALGGGAPNDNVMALMTQLLASKDAQIQTLTRENEAWKIRCAHLENALGAANQLQRTKASDHDVHQLLSQMARLQAENLQLKSQRSGVAATVKPVAKARQAPAPVPAVPAGPPVKGSVVEGKYRAPRATGVVSAMMKGGAPVGSAATAAPSQEQGFPPPPPGFGGAPASPAQALAGPPGLPAATAEAGKAKKKGKKKGKKGKK